LKYRPGLSVPAWFSTVRTRPNCSTRACWVCPTVIYASAFTVGQTQQALVLQFGRVRTVLNQAGTDKPGRSAADR
jgi:hypothetical protein